MKGPTTLTEAAANLELTFRDVAGGNPRVMFLGRDDQGRVQVLVHYTGDELLNCTRVEAWVVEMGDTIVARSKFENGQTTLLFAIRKQR